VTPSEWILSIEGTPVAAQMAMGLALFSALAHATLGALQQGRHDPWKSRGAIDISGALMALPVALFLMPWPEPFLWLVLGERVGRARAAFMIVIALGAIRIELG